MKKYLLLFIAIIGTASTVNAQAPESVKYGFRLGANYSNISGDDLDDDLNSRFGMHANFFADIYINDKFSIQPEIGLSALGVNENELRLENGDNVQLKTNWLQVTVLANLNLSERLFLVVGPQVGTNVTERDNNDYYNYDFAGVLGIGYMMDENWGLDLRYGYGLSNVFDREFGDGVEGNNRWFQLGVSYKL